MPAFPGDTLKKFFKQRKKKLKGCSLGSFLNWKMAKSEDLMGWVGAGNTQETQKKSCLVFIF